MSSVLIAATVAAGVFSLGDIAIAAFFATLAVLHVSLATSA
jgi:hypothetical protein